MVHITTGEQHCQGIIEGSQGPVENWEKGSHPYWTGEERRSRRRKGDPDEGRPQGREMNGAAPGSGTGGVS